MTLPPLLDTRSLRDVERRGAELVAPGSLMDRAGLAVARAASAMAPDTGAPILVVAGPGNNGGDAWVAAAELQDRFHRVIVHDAAGTAPRAPEARAAAARFLAAGGRTVPEWPRSLAPGLVVDGLFGIGLARDLEGAHAALVRRINAARCAVLSIDIPSGLDSDTGRVRGIAVRATRTLTFIARKPGLHTGDAPDHAGEIALDTLGLPDSLFAGARGSLLVPEALAGWLPRRPRNSHKGSFGTVAIVGGTAGMTGAALLAGRASLLAGAGKTFVCVPGGPGLGVDPLHPELMLRTVEDALSADVVVAGPGGGAGEAFTRHALPSIVALPRPVVLDADALNALAANDVLKAQVATGRSAPTILTPHPAEAARLLGSSTASVQDDRLAAALALASRFRAEVVLKGAGSVCASPDGTWAINATGNPGLASGGTGDVLAGLVGALLAQGLAAPAALRYAVCLHGAAADACVARGDGPIGLTASEVALEARRLLNRWT